MTTKNIAVFGIYSHMHDVESALTQLQEGGFRNEDVSVLFPDNTGSKDLATLKSSKAPEGAVAGASAGAVVGGALGWLAAVGALAIPGVGPFLAAGPIIAALAGAGAGGIAGGISGGLVGLGMPEFEAKRFEGRIRKGGILVSVHCDNPEWVKRAKVILEHSGAVDIASTKESAADYGQSDRPRPMASVADAGEVVSPDTGTLRTQTISETTPLETSNRVGGIDTLTRVCESCGASFDSDDALLEHRRASHHGAAYTDSDSLVADPEIIKTDAGDKVA